MVDTKTCSKCNETKALSEFRKVSYNSCEACRKAYKKAWYEANKEKNKEQSRVWYEANKEYAKKRAKLYREANKEKRANIDKLYREANKEKIRERRIAYREANKEILRERCKAYREANKETLRERKRLEFKRNYHKRKHTYRANWAAYMARKKDAIPFALDGCPLEKERLLKIYKLRDVISKATGVEHHVDHMWPLSDGGPHWSGNLQIITAEENLRKSAYVCEETKKVIQESLEYSLQEYKRRQNVRNRHTR